MAGQYDSAVALALRLIKKFGRVVTFNELGVISGSSLTTEGGDTLTTEDGDTLLLEGGAGPSATPWRADAPNVVISITQPAVFLPISALDDLGLTLTADQLEKRATESVLTAPGAVDLSKSHQIVDGETYTILWTKVLKPGPTVVLYAMGIAR